MWMVMHCCVMDYLKLTNYSSWVQVFFFFFFFVGGGGIKCFIVVEFMS